MYREYENMHIYPNMHEINTPNRRMPILDMHAFQTSQYKVTKALISICSPKHIFTLRRKISTYFLEIFSPIFTHIDMGI